MPKPYRRWQILFSPGERPYASLFRVLGRRLLASTLANCALVLLLGMIVPVSGVLAQNSGVSLVVSSNVALADPGQKELAAIFLGHKRHWSDGTRIKIAILEAPTEQGRFLHTVANRSASQYWAHWRNIVFSGRGSMPKIFRSEEAILKYITEEKGVIGQITNADLAIAKGVSMLTFNGATQP